MSINSNADSYREQIIKLLPQGMAWNTDPSSNFYKVIDAMAQEFARVDAMCTLLVDESFPDTTLQLLPNWERVAGLPDECSELGDTIQVRRMNLLAKIAARGGQTIAYFIEVALKMGFTITISEYNPFRVDYSAVEDGLNDEDWQFAFLVSAPEETVVWFRSGGSAAGEPLATWGNERLECLINRLKPAHTLALFAYG